MLCSTHCYPARLKPLNTLKSRRALCAAAFVLLLYSRFHYLLYTNLKVRFPVTGKWSATEFQFASVQETVNSLVLLLPVKLFLVFILTVKVSRQSEQLKRLTQEVALLEERLMKGESCKKKDE